MADSDRPIAPGQISRVPRPSLHALPLERHRIARVIALVSTGVIGIFAVAVMYATYEGALRRGEVGYDIGLYVRIAHRWLDTGQLYYPAQFAGPYPNAGEVNLYPPIALYWFLPFVWLPRLLWWAIPMAIVGSIFWHWRPAFWAWPIFAAIAATVPFTAMLTNGNSAMWPLAVVALATRWPWVAVLLACKPSVFPVALVFAGRRSWWIAAGAVGVAWLPLIGYTGQWIEASKNLAVSAFLYSVAGLPVIVAPLLARAASTRYPPSLGPMRAVIPTPYHRR